MKKTDILGGIAAAAFLALLLGLALHWQRRLEDALPPRTACADLTAARIRAGEFADTHGGQVVGVLGTGSMAPYIPAGRMTEDGRRISEDGKTQIVAYVVTVPGATFADIGRKGRLVIYRPDWNPAGSTMHLAAVDDGEGWILTGLHNAGYENRWRVRPENFVALAAHTFTTGVQP